MTEKTVRESNASNQKKVAELTEDEVYKVDGGRMQAWDVSKVTSMSIPPSQRD